MGFACSPDVADAIDDPRQGLSLRKRLAAVCGSRGIEKLAKVFLY